MQYDDETLRRLQLAELDILIAIDAVCREHGITYFLDSGTALGARRHAGFIPWDDDIDIAMPRDDYERFLGLAQEALGDEYVVANPENDARPQQTRPQIVPPGQPDPPPARLPQTASTPSPRSCWFAGIAGPCAGDTV